MTKDHLKILLLSGSSEGFALAANCAAMKGVQIISSFAGRTSVPKKPVGTWRTGGFGGVDGLCRYLKEEKINAIIDATHPFAQTMSGNARQAAGQLSLPLLPFWRPPWGPMKGDHWIDTQNLEMALDQLTPAHNPAFLTTGRSSLSAAAKRPHNHFIVRVIEPHADDARYHNTHIELCYQKGPFSLQEELRFLKTNNIKAIISKNSGGAASYPKLEAARTLSLPVFMIARPYVPKADYAQSVDEAINWIKQLSQVKAVR